MSLLVVYLPFDSPGDTLNDKLFTEALNLVDSEAQAKIKKFYRREDAWRGLTAQLLLRYAMKERGISPGSAVLKRTQAGKPYLDGDVNLPFNITHDNSAVMLAYGDRNPPEEIGVDVMKLELPRNETISSFIQILQEQLSESEQVHLTREGTSDAGKLSDIFLLWTLKEAYSKALGLGLSFDFSRLDYDFNSQTLRVDGKIPSGWEIRIFDLQLPPPSPSEPQEGNEDKQAPGVTYHCSVAQKLSDSKDCRLSREPPSIRYLDVSTLVSELTNLDARELNQFN